MYNIYNSKDGCMGDDKRDRKYGDLEYFASDNSYYNCPESKEEEYKDKKNDHKEENGCIIINIYCDNCKKEPKKDEGKDPNKDCGKDSHRESNKDSWKDDCKDHRKDHCKEDHRKENDRKEDRSCVIINIYCDRNK